MMKESMDRKRKTALSVDDFSTEHFDKLKACGIEAIEVSCRDSQYPLIPWPKVVQAAKEREIALWSFHLPFSPFCMNDISSTDAFVRKTTIDYMKLLIDRAAGYAGIRIMVIHASGEPISDAERPKRMEGALAGLAELCDFAATYGATLAVEDLPRTCLGRSAEEMACLLSADERLRICFDTNHLLGGQKPQDFIRALGSKIVTLHVSDYDGLDEKHWLPGEGVIDWPAVMDALDDVGYTGPILYEVGYETPKTIVRPQPLVTADFVRNHAELEARAALTVTGVPAVKSENGKIK